MNNKAYIPFRLPGLNEYTNACRSNKFAGAGLKKTIESNLFPFLQSLDNFIEPVKIMFIWHEKTKRRDIDNIAFAKKFILDALVNAKKLQGDSQKYVKGFYDGFSFGEKDGVEVIIYPAEKSYQCDICGERTCIVNTRPTISECLKNSHLKAEWSVI